MWAIGVAVCVVLFATWSATAAVTLHDFRSALQPNDRVARWDRGLAALRELTPLAALLAIPILPVAAIIFVSAPSDVKLYPGLMTLGAAASLASLRLRWETEQFIENKRKFPSTADGLTLGDGLQLDCPQCGTALRTNRITRGQVTCPVCRPQKTFQVRPAGGPVIVALGAVLGIWFLAITPWEAGASPLVVAAWSAICAVLCVATPPVLNLRRRLREAPELAVDAFDDMWIAFAVMALTALLFAGANMALPWLAPSPVADMTVRRLLDFQQYIHDLGEHLESARLTLWIAALTLLAMAIAVRLGGLAFAARVNQTYKWAAKALKIGSVVILCLSAFSLTGAVGAADIHKTLSKTFQLDTLSEPGVDHAVDQMSREIASRAVSQIVKASKMAIPSCHGDVSALCPAPIMASLRDEAGIGNAQADLWPHTPDGRAVGHAPSADLAREAATVADELSSAPKAKTVVELPLAAYQDMPAAAATNFVSAVAIETQPSPSKDPLDARRREMADLAVDLIFSALPLDPGDATKTSLGAFPAKLIDAVGDAFKSPFKTAAQDAAVRAMAACQPGADCQAVVRRELANAEHDPRITAFAQAVAQELQGPADHWTQLENRLRTANALTENDLKRMAEPGLQAERAGDWGQLRARLSETGVLDRLNETYGLSELRTQWPKAVYNFALQDSAGPAPPAGTWDRRFARFLVRNPRAAAVFCYFLIYDPEGRKVLAKFAQLKASATAYTLPHLPEIRQRGFLEEDQVTPAKSIPDRPAPPSVDELDYRDALASYVAATGASDVVKALYESRNEEFWLFFNSADLPLTAEGKREQDAANARARVIEEERRKTEEIQRPKEIIP